MTDGEETGGHSDRGYGDDEEMIDAEETGGHSDRGHGDEEGATEFPGKMFIRLVFLLN